VHSYAEASEQQSQISAPAQAVRAIAGVIMDEYRRSRLFYAAFALFVAVTVTATFVIGDDLLPVIGAYTKRLPTILVGITAAALASLGILAVKSRNQGPVMPAMIRRLSQMNEDGMLIRLPLAMLTFSLFMGCYLYWKMKITWVAPFSWDETFARLDAWLLGGRQGWEVLMPMLGHPKITTIIDSAYSMWALLCAAVWLLVAGLKRVPLHLRNHYWLATLLTWLVGLGLGTALSSAGPIYYHHITGDHELYAGLRDYLLMLEAEFLVAPLLQDLLWNVHVGKVDGIGGISAMPSMHNAQALLFVLLAWHLGYVFRIWTIWFAATILLGSVHLGWHYLVDGLLAFAMVPPLWWIAGKLTGSSLARTSAHQRALEA
jgi:hypothetical protein